MIVPPGLPGSDYPILAAIPNTGFSCTDKLPGFYADEAADCQVCVGGGGSLEFSE